MRKSVSLVLFILLISALALLLYPINAPGIRVREGKSLRWAGYAVVTSISSPQNGVVSDVDGSWTVPAVDCSVTPTAYASFWIGIDGYSSSNTIEQIGTESDCALGSARYYAWYEMYPKYAVDLNMKISPGDAVSAEVQYLGGGSFTLMVTDTKTGASFSITQKSTTAARSSAEWIAEVPGSDHVFSFADFVTVTFQSAHATLNGHAGTISDSAWQYDRIDMVSSSGSSKATTSALSTDGTSFSVEYYLTTTATVTTTSTTSTTGTSTMTSQSTTTSATTSGTTTTPVTTQTTTQPQTTTTATTQHLTTSTTQIATATTTQVGLGAGIGFAFAAIAIGVGVASAGAGLAVAATGQPQSEVFTYAGYYYCRKHRVPVWYVQGGLWCPVEQRYLRP